MKSRTITTPDYTATEWGAGSKLKASQMNAISATLDAVENEVRTIGETTIPAINTAVSDLQSKVAGLETAGSALDLPEGQTVTEYVDQKVADLVGSAPETLDTIAEVAAALEQSEDAVEAINQLVTENSTAIDAVEAKVDEVATQVQTINEMLPEQLDQKQDKGDYPVYQKFSAGADPAERKTIQLANADSISGVSTSGGGANLIMMSKWDKVDIGSVNYQMNLNSPSGVVQINDEKVVATTDQIPDVTKFVTNETLQTAVDGKQDKGDYALKSDIPDVSDFVTTEKLTEQLTTKQDAGDYPVYKQFVAGASDKLRKTIQLANADSISGVMSTGTGVNLAMVSEWDKADFGSSQLPLNLNATDGIVTINDSKTVATVDQIPDVSEFTTTSYVDSKVNSALEPLATKEAVAGLKVIDLGTFEKVENASYAAGADGIYNNKEAVVLTFDTAEGSGVIFNTMTAANSSAQRMYWNNQVLSRTVTDGSGTGWGVLSNFTELQNRAIKSTLFTLTTEADSETIKAAMTNENSKTITASDLDSCLKYGYTIRDYALQSGSIFVGWTGSAYTLTYIGFASPTSEPYVMSVVVNVTPAGEYSIVRNGTRGQILTSSNLASNKTFAAVADVAPVIVNINLRDSKLTTEVQEKETILGWFGVTTDVELKQLIASTRPMFVRYGISLSTNPHYYKMPIEYVAYESATQLKMVFSGLDTSNDQPVRYTIVANLDGTPIEEGGNVSMVLEPIDTQADIDQLATKQELSDGLAGKAEAVHTHAIGDVTGLQDALDGKQAAGEYLTAEDLPDTSNFATKDEVTAVDQKIPSVEGFATTEALTSGLAGKQDKGDYATNEVVQAEFESYDKTIKAYVDSKLTAVYTYKGSVANEQALPAQDQTVGDVYNVEDTGKNVAWDGEKWDELGATVDLSAYAKTEDVNAQLVTKADAVHTHAIADVNGLQAILDLMPVEIKLPIRTGIGGFQDKLYTQEEIFAWFGVTDLSGFLALAKSTRQVWISYIVGASFQTSAYRYLANYIEYAPDSQSITVIWVGPDSANADVISKFVFKANLDQTVIAGASNVQLTVTSLE